MAEVVVIRTIRDEETGKFIGTRGSILFQNLSDDEAGALLRIAQKNEYAVFAEFGKAVT